MKNINDLPDLCLCRVFSFLPLQDLFNLDRVCPYWGSLQPVVTLKRRYLTLLIGGVKGEPIDLITKSVFTIPHLDEVQSVAGVAQYDPQHCSKWFQVERKSINSKSTGFLMELLPSVTRLEISILKCDFIIIDQLIRLLECWSPSLVTLKLWCQFESQPNEANLLKARLLRLIQAINSLEHLEQLTIDIGHSFFDSDLGVDQINDNCESERFDLSILARLREFYFNSYDFIGEFIDLSLRKHSSDKLARIGTGNFRYADIEREYKLSDEVASKFTILTNHKLFYDASLLQRYTRYQSLTSLSIDAYSQTFLKLAKYLAPFRELIHLELKHVNPAFFQLPTDEDDEDDEQIEDELPRLPSIQIITMSAYSQTHSDLYSPYCWNWLLPGVQVIKLGHGWRCQDCGIVNEVTFDVEKRRNCLRMLLQPLKQCPKLHTVYTGYNGGGGRKWDIADL